MKTLCIGDPEYDSWVWDGDVISIPYGYCDYEDDIDWHEMTENPQTAVLKDADLGKTGYELLKVAAAIDPGWIAAGKSVMWIAAWGNV